MSAPPVGPAFAPPPPADRPPRRPRTALLLAALFGPLGLFYVSVAGGVLMTAITVVSSLFTVGIALGPCWIVCILWALVATADFGADPHSGVPFDDAGASEPGAPSDATPGRAEPGA